jgi:hypothetical protein
MINKSTKQHPIMSKATSRPTPAQLQAIAAKAARKAAAIARQSDDYRQDAGFTAIYSQSVGS